MSYAPRLLEKYKSEVVPLMKDKFGYSNIMEIQPDFKELLALLNAHNVDYVIVGAYALAFHGAPRFTGDIDILCCPSGQRS